MVPHFPRRPGPVSRSAARGTENRGPQTAKSAGFSARPKIDSVPVGLIRSWVIVQVTLLCGDLARILAIILYHASPETRTAVFSGRDGYAAIWGSARSSLVPVRLRAKSACPLVAGACGSRSGTIAMPRHLGACVSLLRKHAKDALRRSRRPQSYTVDHRCRGGSRRSSTLHRHDLQYAAGRGQARQAIEQDGCRLEFCYEAGGCGYGIYRQLTDLGHGCIVAAPTLIPRKPGDRIKTDRRDSQKLALQHRSGDLTAMWVPDEVHEAMRDLVRAGSTP
jgi:hypothetical protein